MNLHLPQFTASEEEINRSPNSARAIRRWLKELPLVNMGESTKLFFTTLKTLNRQAIDCRTRFELMELMRPTARIILKHLARHFAALSLPISGRSKQIDRLAESLLQELAVGYKLVVHDVATGRDKLDRRQLAIAAHRALRYLEETLARNAALYKPDARSVWHDMHRILGFAETFKLTQIEVADEDHRTIDASTIEDVYKQACLLAMSEPPQLRTGEAERLRAYFETACHLCEMKRTLIPDQKGMVHVASLKSSEPPAFIPLANITTFSNLRGFDLTRLVSTLRDMLTSQDNGSGFSKVPLEPHLIERLLHAWSHRERRRFSRVTTQRTVVATLGLKNIIHAINADTNPFLSKEELFIVPRKASAREEEILERATADAPYSLTGEFELHDGLHYDYNTTDQLLHPGTLEKRKLPETWVEWRAVNTGAGGYGLVWESDEPCNLHVGEIVALREKEYDEFQWRIGLVRWLRHRPETGMDVGVQLIAPRGTVVHVDDIRNRSHPGMLPIEALMLPGMKTIKQLPSLLLPAQAFLPEDVLELTALGKKLFVQLKKQGESTSYYTQFYYKSTEVQNRVDAREEFEDLWSRL